MEWFEALPEQCPPENAFEPNNELFYRIVRSENIEFSDFISQREADNTKVFTGISECTARTLSVFNNLDATKKLLKLPKFRNKKIAEIILSKEDGLLLKTFTNPYHYSWWRAKSYDISRAKLYRNE
ncbi:hypothetical protein Barb6_01067 [Bacteroidales bacterium Barb6]|nr:hypothetical protein Barb6_01067 [Bacteroidales bacterium Barb6]